MLCVPITLDAQSVAINAPADTAHHSAVFDVSAMDKGVLMPRMTTAERQAIVDPAKGLMVIDTTVNALYMYDTDWQRIQSWISDLSPSSEIYDADRNTGINTEPLTNYDRIYYYIAGKEAFRMQNNSQNVPRLETANNVCIGDDSGMNLSPSGYLTGQRNVFIGEDAGHDGTTSGANVAIGYKSSEDISTGNNNVALGYQSAQNITTGSINVAVGMSALAGLTTSSSNTAIGQAALAEPSIASFNVGVGARAGQNNAGGFNTMIGSLAGSSSSGDGNVFLGYSAGSTSSGGNKLYIENSSSKFPLIYGEFDNDLVRINGLLNVNGAYSMPDNGSSAGAVMTYAGQGNELVWTPYRFPTAIGSVGQVLRTNNNGGLTWQDDLVDDADNNPTNELQTLSLSGDDLTLSSGNTVTVKQGKWEGANTNIHYSVGSVGIGGVPSNRFEVRGDPVASEVVDFSTGNLTVNQDLLNLSVGAASDPHSQVIEAFAGSSRLLTLNSNGQLFLNDVSPVSDFAIAVHPHVASGRGIYSEGDAWFNHAVGQADTEWVFGNNNFVLDSDVAGDSRFITDEIELRGGSDLAEYFDVAQEGDLAVPGMLVSIDPNGSGNLKVTETPHCSLLAGVISGANGLDPGIVMGQSGSIAYGDYPITLAGRAYVLADESTAVIRPGDLLTSSDRAGYTMKADREDLLSGACLGKALTSSDDKGFVLVLINVH